MSTSRKTAVIVGVLFIIGTLAGVLSVVLTSSILNGPDFLAAVAANENQVIIAALLVLTMGLVLAMVPVVIFPILKQHNEVLAGVFGLTPQMSTIQMVTNLPIFLQEMVMAVWLIVKGFNASAIASGSAKEKAEC